MGVVLKTKFSEISNHNYFRFDSKFHLVSKTDFQNYVYLKDIFEIINGISLTEFYVEEKTTKPFIRIGDLSYSGLINDDSLIYLNEDYEINEVRKLQFDDLVLATIGATVGKVNMVKDFQGGTFSNNTVCLRIKNKDLNNPFFYEKLLRTKLIQTKIWGAVSQKAQPNLQDYDLKYIRLPYISFESQCNLFDQIQPIENEITQLKNSKLKPLDIINQVFGEEFGFDWEEFEKLKKQKTYTSNLNEFANNIDCRMGLKFHNLAGKYLHSFLVSNTTKKVKDFIDEPIVLGKSVSPNDYDKDGEYFYIAMSNIKTYAFDPEDCKKVTDDYAKSNLKKTVQKGDILLARSGEGTIGKVALIEDEDLNAIFSDFTHRIRLTNYNTLFAYYYFRSEFFQYLVYTHKKGLGNNTNIFPSQIQEFPIPDWDNTKQTSIVEKIKTQIDAQNSIDCQIEEKQQEINKIIENAIKAI